MFTTSERSPLKNSHAFRRPVRRALALALSLTGLLPSGAASALEAHTHDLPKQGRDVSGQLIVKLRPAAGARLEQALRDHWTSLESTGLDWLDRLNARYGVTKITPTFSAPPDIEMIKRKFPQRTKRAPPGADVPRLQYIYTFTVSSTVAIPQAAADFAAHPDIEYAHPNYLMTIQDSTHH